MNKRVLFFLFHLVLVVLVLAATPATAQGPDFTGMNLTERLILRLPGEIADEVYPRPWHTIQRLLASEVWNHQMLDTEEWEDAEDDTFRDVFDAVRRVAEIEIEESDWFQNLGENAGDWFNLKIRSYWKRPKGSGTPKKLTVEIGFDGDEDEKESRWGVSFSHIDDPRPFVRFGHRPRQEILWHPVREKIEWYFREIPRNFDLKFELDYGDDPKELTFRFLDFPLGFELPKNFGGGLLLSYEFDHFNEFFDHGNFGFKLGIWARF